MGPGLPPWRAWTAPAVALAALGLLAAPAGAAEPRPLAAPSADAAADPLAGPVEDGLRPPRARAAGVLARASATTAATADGHTIRFLVSPAYRSDPATERLWVAFLASRLHGPELGRLSVLAATPREIETEFCQKGAIACYDPATSMMYVPGERTSGDEPSQEEVITHEYGHHVANHRLNPPWRSFDAGPKRWSTAKAVCARTHLGKLSAARYWDDPGEAFAESYAVWHYRALQWDFNPLLAPDPIALAALERDVREPWTAPATTVRRGAVDRRRRRSFRFRLAVPLDGALDVTLRGPRRSDLDLVVTSAGRRLAGDFATGRTGRVTIPALCSHRLVTVRVQARRGHGRVRVTATRD